MLVGVSLVGGLNIWIADTYVVNFLYLSFIMQI